MANGYLRDAKNMQRRTAAQAKKMQRRAAARLQIGASKQA
jgi:hypothetical protein